MGTVVGGVGGGVGGGWAVRRGVSMFGVDPPAGIVGIADEGIVKLPLPLPVHWLLLHAQPTADNVAQYCSFKAVAHCPPVGTVGIVIGIVPVHWPLPHEQPGKNSQVCCASIKPQDIWRRSLFG